MHVRSLTASRRQRILAARIKPDPIDNSDHPPRVDSVLLMSDIDAMPKAWRDLVREYGYGITMAMRQDGLSASAASDALWLRRCQKQAEWLGTNFFLRRA